MESDSTLPWLIQAASLALFFLASLGEASVASIGRERVLALAAQRVRGSTALEALYATPMGPAGSISLLKAALFASSLVSAVAAVVTQWGVDWALVSMASLATLALLGSGSAISRVLARRFGETVALGAAPVARQLARAAWPLLALEETAARWVLRSPPEEDDNEAMKPEAGLAKESNGQPLDEREARMIRGVVRLDKTTAREIMVPRVDMLAAEMGVPLSHLVQQMVDTPLQV